MKWVPPSPVCTEFSKSLTDICKHLSHPETPVRVLLMQKARFFTWRTVVSDTLFTRRSSLSHAEWAFPSMWHRNVSISAASGGFVLGSCCNIFSFCSDIIWQTVVYGLFVIQPRERQPACSSVTCYWTKTRTYLVPVWDVKGDLFRARSYWCHFNRCKEVLVSLLWQHGCPNECTWLVDRNEKWMLCIAWTTCSLSRVQRFQSISETCAETLWS